MYDVSTCLCDPLWQREALRKALKGEKVARVQTLWYDASAAARGTYQRRVLIAATLLTAAVVGTALGLTECIGNVS